MRIYFITGATGVVGNALVQRLLAFPDTRLKLLIRANSRDDFRRRRDSLLRDWQQSADSSRIEVLHGDTELPLFGLDASTHQRMGRECTHLIHCAAMVRMNLPLEAARKSALGGARELLHLARACRRLGNLEKVEFLSTVGVGGRLPGTLPERWITEERTFHNTYEQAKAEAEDCLREAIQDIPITLHRPSMVVGDSETGQISHFQIFYHLVEFLTGTRTLGLIPSLEDAYLDIVPVNYVADAVIWSSHQSATGGKILHLCAGPEGAISLARLRKLVREQFALGDRNVPAGLSIPVSAFRMLIPVLRMAAPSSLRRAIDTLPVFLDYLAGNQTFSNADTTILLSRHGISLPTVEAYLPRVLSYYLRQKPIP